MKILAVLTYYRPHVSGLTIYVERLVRALAARGHEVTVLTSHYDPSLPREEMIDGVRIVRVPVAFRLSKGVIMPTFGLYSTRLVRDTDVISAHLPQFDAWGIALRGRLFGKPCVLTYHCDLELPAGTLNRVIDQTTFVANYVAATAADKIVAYTQDYADHSRLLRRFKRKIEVILPPVPMLVPTESEVEQFKQAHGLEGRPVLGMAARFATEKGVEVLLNAAPLIEQRFPDYKVLFAGPYKDIPGEEDYRARLFPRVEAMGGHWEFLGTLAPAEMPAFYGSLDALLVPSVNMTESFGLVQVEAMLCGTPVVASNLPGVRQPVQLTGMGEVIPIGESAALAEAVGRILSQPDRYQRSSADIAAMFGLEQTVDSYERLFEAQLAKRRHHV
ncbi:MAG TPA: glycosyltransferase family 4 protein [Dehalococcoidia bacterium]|nr:glycosyltransferase family 4 protein [Dehalococcoidia bacterium]